MISAGILLIRLTTNGPQFLCIMPGGPWWRGKSKQPGSWGIPKGGIEDNETLIEAGLREFNEETNVPPPSVEKLFPLGRIQKKQRKAVYAWGFVDDSGQKYNFKSNTFKAEWPKKSGIMRDWAEVTDYAYFSIKEAKKFLHPAQQPFIDRAIIALERRYPKYMIHYKSECMRSGSSYSNCLHKSENCKIEAKSAYTNINHDFPGRILTQ